MPIHDWTRVEAGIFHDFHHGWIEEIKRSLNAGLLPDDYYALAEQRAAGFEPDVLTLQGSGDDEDDNDVEPGPAITGGRLLLASPKMQATDATDLAFYRRKQKMIAVRHVSGDRLVAMVEIVSPGNKSSRNALRAFVRKSAELLDRQIHLLILDLHPLGRRDPEGIHGAIWEYMTDRSYRVPTDKPLTLAAYECDSEIRAYVVHAAVGETLTDMPLFLMPGGHVPVPLEATYQSAFAAVPRRWRRVLETPSSTS
ncbi:MAG TPA: DUF4058 family protein [Gemmataceae bacterium]|nr:DUF4058 family protein [Gemmataceae bacterium]